MAEGAVREQLLELLQSNTTKLSWDELGCFTAQQMADHLGVSRNLVSQYLTEYLGEGKVIKVNTRPVYYFHREALSENLRHSPSTDVYSSLDNLREDLALNPARYSPFAKMVGSSGSLRYCVEQCKAAICYPNGGLPLLIHGPTGTGKSVMAQLTYEYAVEKGILSQDSRFVTVNCSEYANNPELLLTNLFGYRKGAYTGAERDRKGLVALADGGVLFLDEVHCLKSECQEKLFLFMDKGIYHMVGDNETWYNSRVRLIFATTESPEGTLLRTLLRRIPIVTNVPSLDQRPLQDKRELISYILLSETQRTNRNILISVLAYQAILEHTFVGNVGQLGNCLRASIANSLVHDSKSPQDDICIHLYNLPAVVISGARSTSSVIHSDKTMLDLIALRNLSTTEPRLLTLGTALCKAYAASGGDDAVFWKVALPKLEQYIDYLFFSGGMEQSPRLEVTTGVLTNIFDSIARKYSIGCLSNNEILAAARFLCDYMQDVGVSETFATVNRIALEQLLEHMRRARPIDFTITNDICQMITNSLNININAMGLLTLAVYIRYFGNDQGKNSIPGIILAHGFSTASSIVQATNHLLNGHLFDAIDMPVDSKPESVTAKLRDYIKRMENCTDLVIMVDMGSLEQIYKDLACPESMTVGVINNITTRMALHIGSMIQQGLPVREILEKAAADNVSNYTVLENRKRQKALLTVCATGIGTAEKLAKLIEDSLPHPVELLLLPYDYDSICSMGKSAPVFEKYDVQLIAGTLNPGIKGLEFVSVEELVEQSSRHHKLSETLAPYLTAEELQCFSNNIIRNFSLQNLLDYLTILNPEKIVLHVEQIIEQLQIALDIPISSSTKVGLFLHISCMIERLITDKHIASYCELERFSREQSAFIALVKESFAQLEKSYSVTIPISEIGYLHEYLYRQDSVVSTEGGLVSMFND